MKFLTVRQDPTNDVGIAHINPQYIISIRPKFTPTPQLEVIGSTIRVVGEEIAIYYDYRKPKELLEFLETF